MDALLAGRNPPELVSDHASCMLLWAPRMCYNTVEGRVLIKLSLTHNMNSTQSNRNKLNSSNRTELHSRSKQRAHQRLVPPLAALIEKKTTKTTRAYTTRVDAITWAAVALRIDFLSINSTYVCCRSAYISKHKNRNGVLYRKDKYTQEEWQ